MVHSLILFIGGLGLFLYGLDRASQGFQKIFAGRMKQWLTLLTQNRGVALVAGILLTFCFQSSSVTTVFLVSLASLSILNLGQTLGVILGADIGTTLTIQLIAFRLDQYALLVFVLGLIIFFTARYERTRSWGRIFIGFGLLFYGMLLMKEGMVPLAQSPAIFEQLVLLQQKPFLLLVASLLLTAVIQSSAATLAIAFAMMATGNGEPLLSFQGAVPILLGANIGTCATALLAGIRANRVGRQVALAHLLFKVGAVCVVFPFLSYFAVAVEWLTTALAGELVSPVRKLANAHTLFNMGAALLFLPFIQWVPRGLEWLIPKKKEKEGELSLLTESLLRSPFLALEEADKEIKKLSKQVARMWSESLTIFQKEDSYLIEDVWKFDEQVDKQYKELTTFLNKLSQTTLTSEEVWQMRSCFLIAEELEHIGDVITRELTPLAQKKLDGGIRFSDEGSQDLKELHQILSDNLDEVLKAYFSKERGEKALTFLRRKSEQTKKFNQSRFRHLDRLHKGLKESLESSAIHLDVLNAFLQIRGHILSIARISAGKLKEELS